jgi:hypothetical protein
MLIITTGDISDVDGFLALAEYAKAGADVLFIMNYPAYIGVETNDPTYDEKYPGLGYQYTLKEFFQAKGDTPTGEYLKQFDGSDKDRMKAGLSAIAFGLCKKVWEECSPKGRFYFYIGGTNAINPFSPSAIKDEIRTYLPALSGTTTYFLDTTEGATYGIDGAAVEKMDWEAYKDVFMDFNGSMAFWDAALWGDRVRNLRCVVVMGGVYSDEKPITMPSIKNTLNRLSSATMNQLYHPGKTADFFDFLQARGVKTLIVPNNTVADLKEYGAVQKFLAANGLTGPFLGAIADAYYNLPNKPPKKPFDFYTALALGQCLSSPPAAVEKSLFYNGKYGITFVSQKGDWDATREAFASTLDLEVKADDVPFIRAKKENLKIELGILDTIGAMGVMPVVYDVQFNLDPETLKLSV